MHLHSSVSGVSRPKHVQEVKKKIGGGKEKLHYTCKQAMLVVQLLTD